MTHAGRSSQIFISLIALVATPTLRPEAAATSVLSYSCIQDLEAGNGAALLTGSAAIVGGYYAAGDGGGGTFVFDRATKTPVNGGTVLRPADGEGRWLRITAGPLNVRWFGAYGDGIHDDTSALQSAINHVCGGAFRGAVYIPPGVYKISDSLTLGTGGLGLSKPLIIQGEGQASQIVNAARPNHPTFAFRGVAFWRVTGLLLTGDSSNPNDGIVITKDEKGDQSGRFVIENVITETPGRGFVLQDCNTGVIRDCKHWPSSNSRGGAVFPHIRLEDISHGIYLTGDFCNDISIYDFDCEPSSRYGHGMCAIKSDASVANEIRIIGGVLESDASGPATAIELRGTGPFTISGVYAANAAIVISGCTYGVLSSIDQQGSSENSALKIDDHSSRCSVTSHHGGTLAIDASCEGIEVVNSEFDHSADAISDRGQQTVFRNVSERGKLFHDGTQGR